MRKILVPYDFSRGSELALAYSVGFALRTGGEVTLLHVVDIPDHLVAGMMGTHVDIGEFQRRALRAASDKLHEIAAREASSHGLRIAVEVRTGFACLEIVKYAADERFELLILSTHGRRGLPRLLLGSEAETVVRTSPCPVLALKLPEAGDGDGTRARDFDLTADPLRKLHIANVLLATDLSEFSLEALPVAATVAETFQASLTLLHVVEDLSLYTHIQGAVLGDENDAERQQEVASDRARRRLRRVLDDALPGARWVNLEIGSGSPYQEIVAKSREKPFDLIVLATHGRSGWQRTVLGSVAERVVRLADCPVLTVPVRAAQDETRPEKRSML